jgi:hypothetical protein
LRQLNAITAEYASLFRVTLSFDFEVDGIRVVIDYLQQLWVEEKAMFGRWTGMFCNGRDKPTTAY